MVAEKSQGFVQEEVGGPMNKTERLNSVLKTRSNMFTEGDSSLISSPVTYKKVEDIVELKNGRIAISVHNMSYQCVYCDSNEKRLFVVLNGAQMKPYPEFKRWTYYAVFDGCMINIADPSYKNSELKCGWYFADINVNYREDIVTIVKKVATIKGITNENIFFFSSSAGGQAAIHCGALIDGSNVVVINPQIKISSHVMADNFQKITGIDLNKDDVLHRDDSIYWLKKESKTKYLIIQNMQSVEDMDTLEYMEKQLNVTCQYGLNKLDNKFFWLYDSAGNIPHNSQEDRLIFLGIQYLAEQLALNNDFDHLRKECFIFSEMWHNKSELEFTKKQN